MSTNCTLVEACLISVIGVATNITGVMSAVAYVNGLPITGSILALATGALVASLYLILKRPRQESRADIVSNDTIILNNIKLVAHDPSYTPEEALRIIKDLIDMRRLYRDRTGLV